MKVWILAIIWPFGCVLSGVHESRQAALLAANPDLADYAPTAPMLAGGPQLLPAGYAVCVLPAVCRTSVAPDGSAIQPHAA